MGAGLQAIGNPYASEINFNNVTFNNYSSGGKTYNNITPGSAAGIGITYCLFDPKTSGSSNVGKFIYFSSNGDGTYAVTANSSGLPTNGLIQSSAAFLISADNSGGTITFHETDKSTSSSTVGVASRTGETTEKVSSLTSNLYAGSGTGALLADGVITAYHSAYLNEVSSQDAVKMSSFNTREVLSIVRDTKLLAIERRNSITANDTIFLNMSNMNKTTYQFEFIGRNLDPSLIAMLEDKYTGTSKPINISEATYISFAITTDEKSGAAERFRIVLNPGGVLPITTIRVKAFRQNNNVAVQWNVENELNIKEYQVEKSINGRDFDKVSSTATKGNNSSTVAYSWLDESVVPGDNFYRIKSITLNGTYDYTEIVKVEVENAKAGIAVYPNPVTNGKISLQLNNMPSGAYEIKLINSFGQLVSKLAINHTGGTASQSFIPSSSLSKGMYNLQVIGPDQKANTVKVIVQ